MTATNTADARMRATTLTEGRILGPGLVEVPVTIDRSGIRDTKVVRVEDIKMLERNRLDPEGGCVLRLRDLSFMLFVCLPYEEMLELVRKTCEEAP